MFFSYFNYSDEILNAMGSARLEIMDEREEDKEKEKSPQRTVAQQKVSMLVNVLYNLGIKPYNNNNLIIIIIYIAHISIF